MKNLVAVLMGLALFFGCCSLHAEEAQPAKVNINTASADQLRLLPRVGESIAKRILEFREKNGEFKKVEDLMLVKGIGPKNFETLKPYLAVSGTTTLKEDIKVPRKQK
jgi:competence protein ComEA